MVVGWFFENFFQHSFTFSLFAMFVYSQIEGVVDKRFGT